jgi:hypothetical protein
VGGDLAGCKRLSSKRLVASVGLKVALFLQPTSGWVVHLADAVRLPVQMLGIGRLPGRRFSKRGSRSWQPII